MYTKIGTYYSFQMTLVLVGYVSGVFIAHHQEVQPYVYNNWYLLFCLDDCLLFWLDSIQPG